MLHLCQDKKLTVPRASYDAWGKQTITPKAPFPFYRGYTGHEHLPEFGLINMNGRMYDPVVARFLSPDPYVQVPDFSQNFNRYSYCFNNPLMYTDPSGEYAIIDDLIVAAVGGTINLIANAVTGNVNSWQEGLSYFGVGAAGAWAGMYTGPLVAGAIVSGGNSIVSQTEGFQKGLNNVKWDQVGMNATMGAITGQLSGAIGTFLDKPLNTVYSNITSPILNNTLKGSTSGFISGFSINAGMAKMNGANWDEAFSSGLDGGVVGATVGAGTSVVSWLRYAKTNYINPWTGKAITADDIINNPKLVKGKSLETVLKIRERSDNWEEGTMKHGRRKGEGWTYRELNNRGTDYTGKYIQYSPGSPRHNDGRPYWKISSGKQQSAPVRYPAQ